MDDALMTSPTDIATAQPGESANSNSANMHRHTNQPMANLASAPPPKTNISLRNSRQRIGL